ncbi:hypothetical protein Vadar_015367 [Vaccinium darrowii]|uniref:Uncharacterized protein n=1 Tax=Vaccinium darrowii TaxID=229202 RepID=A0ACB7YDW2_9ERIC|nr:hypothetical protein Vadar_015367 [Vaccinium darrowii]
MLEFENSRKRRKERPKPKKKEIKENKKSNRAKTKEKKVLRSIRVQSPTLFSSPQFPYQISRSNCSSGLSFKQKPAADDKMDKQQQQTNNRNTKTGDVTSHSFGEGYGTRCDDEGFGGTYGGNDPLSKEDQEQPQASKIIHESHPEYDRTQGSEVAEKEKARHQKTAES